MSIFLSFLLSIAGSVIAHYIVKMIDKYLEDN